VDPFGQVWRLFIGSVLPVGKKLKLKRFFVGLTKRSLGNQNSIVPACANKRKMIQLADACNERHERHERHERYR